MIPPDTPDGTVIWELDGDHELPCLRIEKQVLDMSRGYPSVKGQFGFPTDCDRDEIFLTEKEAAAACLQQHLEVLKDVGENIRKMIDILNGEGEAVTLENLVSRLLIEKWGGGVLAPPPSMVRDVADVVRVAISLGDGITNVQTFSTHDAAAVEPDHHVGVPD